LQDFGSGQVNIIDTETNDALIRKEFVNKVNLEMENLPSQCKLIFYKSRFEGKKYAEIASDLNLSVKTVEAQIGKALKILRQRLYEDNILVLLALTYFLNRIL